MGILFGVQPTCCECMVPDKDNPDMMVPCLFEKCEVSCDIALRRLRTGATDEEVLWFEATHISGITVKADEIEGKPGVMSTTRARGDDGKQRIIEKLMKAVEEAGE